MTDRAAPSWPVDRRRSADPQRAVTLTDLVRVPFSRWRTVAVTALAGLAVAVGYVVLVPATVTASAVVAVRPVVTDAFTPSGAGADRSVNMNVESGIATSTEVIQLIAKERAAAPVDVRDALQIEVPTGGQILRFSYTDRSVDVAVATVNLAAETYLQVRKAMYEKQRTAMLQSYDGSIAKVVQQQTGLQRRIGNSDTGAAAAALAELGAVNTQLAQLNSARTEIASIDVTPGWVTQSAEPLTTPKTNRLLYVLAGLLGGLLLGIVLAYVLESTQRVVRTAADAHDAAGLPLLGTVRSRGFRMKTNAVDADVRYVAMAIAERFKNAVRTPVVVIASRAREDTTLMTASLAVALAADGKDVYVGDDSGRLGQLRTVLMADRRPAPATPVMPRQNRTSPGLTGGHNGAAGSDATSTHVDADATVTLPRITAAMADEFLGTSTADGVATATMAQVPVRTVSAEVVTVGTGRVQVGPYQAAPETEIVLFNAPPAESDERGVREARSGTAIVVVERNRTKVEDLRRLVERLRAAGADPLGYVFTRSGRG
ncbi:lipopolysaccharide biosynthesis protein [Micromonospora sp. NPDC049679]|uniref:lipopolysaccharide biosynthesis protein n=1 Tax=Micromonospora sp. NPDC049679 TaxID=3155920 RepID=UPI0033F89A9D